MGEKAKDKRRGASRRDFLKGAAIVGAGMGLGAFVPTAEMAQETPEPYIPLPLGIASAERLGVFIAALGDPALRADLVANEASLPIGARQLLQLSSDEQLVAAAKHSAATFEAFLRNEATEDQVNAAGSLVLEHFQANYPAALQLLKDHVQAVYPQYESKAKEMASLLRLKNSDGVNPEMPYEVKVLAYILVMVNAVVYANAAVATLLVAALALVFV